MIFYGIDPGFTGAIAIFAPNTGFFDVFDMPTMLNSKGKVELNHFAVLNILEKELEVEHQAWIEKVGAMPGQGVSSMFRFGQCFGALEMAIAASGCVTRYVSPVTWRSTTRSHQTKTLHAQLQCSVSQNTPRSSPLKSTTVVQRPH